MEGVDLAFNLSPADLGLEFDEDSDTCHVKYLDQGQIAQCQNVPAWCLIRARDKVHRPVCDEHKRDIYDQAPIKSELIPRCQECSK